MPKPRSSPASRKGVGSPGPGGAGPVPPGRITAIVGANACGKSTLLRALARLLAPRGGAVRLDGRARRPTSRTAPSANSPAVSTSSPRTRSAARPSSFPWDATTGKQFRELRVPSLRFSFVRPGEGGG
ncbi:ATP-binding cassette domain-containing protein [Streptomyces sp. NPDC059900]|uniref:ATP-binding cassette domain-containing protein n=1 Tax=Streptomyces sp. NPDC059900 TaxID=3155816 RepID=UPI0034253E6E